MILTIDKEDRDIYARACAELTLDCEFYTIETNELLLKCNIVSPFGGTEIMLPQAVHLGRLVENYWGQKTLKS